jgi:hypothetical protein
MKKSNNTISGWLDKYGDPEIDKEVDMTIGIYDMVRNQFHSQSELFLNKQESLETAKFIYELIQKRNNVISQTNK